MGTQFFGLNTGCKSGVFFKVNMNAVVGSSLVVKCYVCMLFALNVDFGN